MNRPISNTTLVQAAAVMLAGCLSSGCNTAKVTSQRDLSAAPAEKPAVIYVADFGLDAHNVQHQEGVLSGRPGPLGRAGNRLYGTPSDPAAEARRIVDLMANSLVKDLAGAGYNARRLPIGAALPTEGWLLQGVFTEVQEGNRLQRAMVGLGQGQTDLQVIVSMANLSKGPPKPLYEINTDASSGNKPGAAPLIAVNPYAAAARFVISGQDLNRNIRNTASQIVTEISRRDQERKQN
jgi:hypothetical protein